MKNFNFIQAKRDCKVYERCSMCIHREACNYCLLRFGKCIDGMSLQQLKTLQHKEKVK